MIKNYTHKSDVIGVDKVQMKLRFADFFKWFSTHLFQQCFWSAAPPPSTQAQLEPWEQ